MSPYVGKAGHSSLRPFSREDLRFAPSHWEGFWTLCDCHWTWCFVTYSLLDVHFLVKGEHHCLLQRNNKKGPDIPLAYSFSLLAAGTLNSKALHSNYRVPTNTR
jgi:hypothetical protein